MADPRKFIYNSDYPTPAFVAKWSGSFTVGGNSYLTPSFNHNLPFTPLVVGQWSLNPNFQPAYDISTQNGYFIGVDFNQIAGSTPTQIKFDLDNGYSTSRTYYYRLFAFAPSDYDGDIPSIEDDTNFRFNSDFNYLKLFAYGKDVIPTGDTLDVYHNLGYTPQAKTWVKDGITGVICPAPNVHYQDGSYTTGTTIDNNKLTIQGVKGDDVYYHIYIDEA